MIAFSNPKQASFPHFVVGMNPALGEVAQLRSVLESAPHAGASRWIDPETGLVHENFNSFAGFEPQLATELNGTVTALRLVAEGSYDAATNIFTARHLVIQLDD